MCCSTVWPTFTDTKQLFLLSPPAGCTNLKPSRQQLACNCLMLYSPICLPYRSSIDWGKPTLYAVDHRQGIHGHSLWYSHRSGSCRPASTISCRETNMALLTHLSVQPWQAHKIALMSSCLRKGRDSSTGGRIKINGFLCSAIVGNCPREGDCLQPGNDIYANVTW